jgi:hypothetical protein
MTGISKLYTESRVFWVGSTVCCLLLMVILLALLFNTAEDGGDMFLRNVRLSDPQGITTALFIVTIVTTSTPCTLHIYKCRNSHMWNASLHQNLLSLYVLLSISLKKCAPI